MNCLNCHHPVSSTFCSNCGQKAATQRFTIGHVVSHDFIHGVFHLDKGFLYTLVELFRRPGHTVREYVQGRRASHFNYFTFFVLAFTAMHFVKELSVIRIEGLFHTHVSEELLAYNNQLMAQYGKVLPFAAIPLFSLLNMFLFRKAKQNLAEHLVINTYKAGGSLLIMALFFALSLVFRHHTDLMHLYVGFSCAQFLYEFVFSYQYFSSSSYSRKELLLRCLVVLLLEVGLRVQKWVIFF